MLKTWEVALEMGGFIQFQRVAEKLVRVLYEWLGIKGVEAWVGGGGGARG